MAFTWQKFWQTTHSVLAFLCFHLAFAWVSIAMKSPFITNLKMRRKISLHFSPLKPQLLSLFRPSKESHLVGRESPWTFSTLPVGFRRSRTLRSFPWDYPCPQWKPYLTRCEKSLEPFQGQRAKLWQTVNTGGFQHQWNRPWHDRHDSRAVGTRVGCRGLN